MRNKMNYLYMYTKLTRIYAKREKELKKRSCIDNDFVC